MNTFLDTLLVAGTVCALTGCASFSNIVADDADGSYNLTATGLSYTESMPELTADCRAKANAYCAEQGKTMQLRQQIRGWHPMQVELNFRCVPPEADQPEQTDSLTAFR